jgi:AraC-like DNA-binding protein
VDLLSAAIGSARIGSAKACSIKESGSWGWRYPPLAGSGFHLLLRGTAWLITADDPPLALTPGDVVLTPFGAEHGLSHAPSSLEDLTPAGMREDQPDRDADIELLCGAYRLDHGQVHHYLRSFPAVIAMSPDFDRNPRLRLLAGLLNADMFVTGPGNGATRSALLDLVLTHALRQWLEENRTGDSPDLADPAIAGVLREIHAAPHRPWTVRQLSEIAAMSRTAFTSRFTSLMGQPPMTYLISWRLTYGAQLLRETDAPLARIARQVGYSTEFAFGASFRREYGISPGRFRDFERGAIRP